ncbi:MAG TPA: entericidin A/B family lipoprotein [Gammaproteobacteria bacterium]|nr:entericidin A/B family lipoprotein [Gammaproteobacteria bacterium]
MGIWMKRLTALAIIAAVLGFTTGCNTMAGFGQDVESAGHAIKKQATGDDDAN